MRRKRLSAKGPLGFIVCEPNLPKGSAIYLTEELF